MDLTQLANLGEFIGGVAVLATLVYLAVQVRSNTRTVRSVNNQAQTDGHCGYLTAVFQDPVLSNIFSRLWSDAGWDDLSEEQKERLPPLFHCAFTQFENAYRSHREGLSDALWWKKQAAALDLWLGSPYIRRLWEEQGSIFPEDFHGYIQGRLAQTAPSDSSTNST